MTRRSTPVDEPYDIFLAHTAADATVAGELYDLLQGKARVFLDFKCLQPGTPWDLELPAAQRGSLMTVVLISASTPSAWYQREEIASAIAESRRPGSRHRIVPV